MGTYQVPRNVKGEGRILFIFSKKAMIYSIIGLGIGFLFSILFGIIKLAIVGYILMIVFAVLGFIIATFKMPETTSFEVTKKTSGEAIDDVIKRAIKFKRSGKRIYVYEKPDKLRIRRQETQENKEEK